MASRVSSLLMLYPLSLRVADRLRSAGAGDPQRDLGLDDLGAADLLDSEAPHERLELPAERAAGQHDAEVLGLLGLLGLDEGQVPLVLRVEVQRHGRLAGVGQAQQELLVAVT